MTAINSLSKREGRNDPLDAGGAAARECCGPAGCDGTGLEFAIYRWSRVDITMED